jgi:hypothetical protein
MPGKQIEKQCSFLYSERVKLPISVDSVSTQFIGKLLFAVGNSQDPSKQTLTGLPAVNTCLTLYFLQHEAW